IMQAYEQISVMKMQKIRNTILDSRDFLDRLAEVYRRVKYAQKQTVEELRQKRDKKELKKYAVFEKNPKPLYVLISANTKLFGDIIPEIFELFQTELRKQDSDILIIGRVGKRMYEESNLAKKPYLYFEISDFDLKMEDVIPILYHLVKYDKVRVFYSRFENIITQKAHVSNLASDEFINTEEQNKEAIKFLFEPTLDRVLGFFEAQVFNALFSQTVHELYLARLASRLKAMERGLGQIEIMEKRLYLEKRKAKRSLENKKQTEKFAGIALWGK
ncbi:MAG: F0F1 ATP synthase subunit gamma, partial [Patescibacteria group bacterium]